MLKAKSLYHLIVYSIFFIIILISFFTFIIINNAHDELQEKIVNLKEDYSSNQKTLLENEIKSTIKFIDYFYLENIDKKPIKDIKKDIIYALNKINLDASKNDYIFIYDFNGVLVDNSHDKTRIGQNFLKFKDSNEKEVVKELIDVSKEENGGFVNYFWTKPEITKETNKISYVASYEALSWTIGKGVYLDEIDRLIKEKEDEYNEKISNYTLQISSLTILLILYSVFIYKNATILIVKDVKEIGKYFKEAQEKNDPINQSRFMFGEFKVIANYAFDAMTNMKLKSNVLLDLNKNLEEKVESKTKELSELLEAQKQFLKNSVHEINTPLAIIRTNLDLLKTKVENNSYITNIEAGSKIIQYIYDDLSFLIKKDRVNYDKEYLNISEFLEKRLNFFEEILKSNNLYIIKNIEEDVYIKFNSHELQRVIDNNLSNAVKYSFAKSPIFIKLFYIDDNEVEFSISTHSRKIDYIDKIFEDFYRENSARGGFGLGLKIVKEICDKNLVIIKVLSDNKDTKFIYRFKLNEDTTA